MTQSFTKKKPNQTLNTENPIPTHTKSPTKTPQTRGPIRPAVNNRTAPSYKVAKKNSRGILKQHLNLDNFYTIDNSLKLAHDLTKLTISNSHRLITLDIRDLYVNIPILETIDIA